MTPQEVAMKLASASATCRNGKCPYTSECGGTSDTCKMKEVSMIIRALLTELATANAQYKALLEINQSLNNYVADLEDINAQYHKLIVSVQAGYRPRHNAKRRKPRKVKKGKPMDPVLMDGDERYAQPEPPKTKPDLPVVII